MIYRSINPSLCQSTTGNKDAYAKVQHLISNCSGSKDDSQSDAEGDSSDEESSKQSHFAVHNVKRREKRAKARIEGLQKSLNYFKRVNKAQQEKIKTLSAALEDGRSLIRER